jgi:Pectic acid lyase
MKTSLRICIFLMGVLVSVHTPGQEPIDRDSATRAMHRAIEFFRTEVSTHGGYVFRVSADLSQREGEVAVGNSTAWIEPPATPAVGQAYLDAYVLTGDKVALEAAKETAKALLQGQLISGGWSESIEFNPETRKKFAYRVDSPDPGKRRNLTTFDDDKTQSAIRFLMQLDDAIDQQDADIHEAVMYALDGVLKSQYANGAWPQRFDGETSQVRDPQLSASYPSQWPREFPNKKYTTYYTLNDSTLIDLIATLIQASDIYSNSKYLDAARLGGNFLLLAQMPMPQPGWAQQYNDQMQPAWARKFEPPAITGGESQAVMRMLLTLYRRTGDRRYFEAVEEALAYYRTCVRADGKLARFYELQTNRPLYFTKQYELTYSDSDMPTHYGFIVESSLDKIANELEELAKLPVDKLWKPSLPKSPMPSSKITKDAEGVIAALDARGAWVEPGVMKSNQDSNGDSVIDSKTFIKNLRMLAIYIASLG